MRPGLQRQSTDNPSRGRARSTSPSLFFRSASASSLLRFRHGRTKEQPPPEAEEDDIDNCAGACACADEEICDVLPSFQMYNALHRHIPRGNVNADQHDLPPSYQEAYNGSVGGISVSSSRVNLTTIQSLDGVQSDSCINLQALSAQQYSLQTPSHDEPIEDDLANQDDDNINIEKLYSLPKMVTPVEIDIRITKHPVKPHKKPEEESILREYTSGDIINGYVVIKNRSAQPLKFEMFYVTLEGYATVIDRMKGKRTVKRFLRMVDISASWSYSSVESANGYAYTQSYKDYDNCILGLSNTRVLEPGVKYKKFFTFKFPMQLLDVSCKHEQFSHCLVPPSFGIDKYKSNGKYATIQTNPLLGYGHLGTKGSPILTNDLVSDTVSINYAVDAKIVGKDSKTGKLNIMREKEYNLRFIPFGFCQPFGGEQDPLQQLEDLTNLIQDRLAALRRVFDRLEKKERIRSQDLRSTEAHGTIDEDIQLDPHDELDRKLRQLYVNNRLDAACTSLPLKDSKLIHPHRKLLKSEFKYSYRTKHKSYKKKLFFSGFYSDNNRQSEAAKTGIILLEADQPKDGFPYLQPSLLKKTNMLANKNKHDQKNWNSLTARLTDRDKQTLENIEVRLQCIQANNSEQHSPPEITAVTTELVCLTAKSVNSIPIKLDAQLLLNKTKLKDITETFTAYLAEVKEYQSKFEENIVQINELYNISRNTLSRRELAFGDFISAQLLHDIECLANLRVDVRNLHHVLKEQIRTLKNPDDDLTLGEPKATLSSNILTATFSGSSVSSGSAQADLYRSQITRDWVPVEENQYVRNVNVNLVLNQDIKETLVPTFESCLCCRMYCIRVNIKFEGQIGVASLDVPVRIRMLEA
ncbi:ABL131Cp [Eremothecium gossypii ATCC 10895]|uniref:ABL131Cp n=1 Tax=Eremothecium gossypii (strain ATCC 10895 / CBS 109.51 / FGSC 9923 / NRRL Y-1056) TaxID=284811 RepID=Q75E04_EREGS|nr:ABL131Cp [Eremothecium gossypii ATCC 10895]AAS50640.1 ABL131Cp [Eremothecium gossypii ATCC 10895]